MPHFSLPLTDPVMIFSLVLLLSLAAPLLARLLHIPSIILLILSGILFGPHILRFLQLDQAVELLSSIGLLYIMFLSGLEIDLDQFNRNREKSLVFGLLTFFIPLLLGILGGYFILKMPLVSSVLLASMFSSHTLLTYPQISSLGLSKRLSVVTGIGGTIITDILAIMILAVITGNTGENDPGAWYWLRLAGYWVLFMSLALFVIPRLGRSFLKRVKEDGQLQFVFVLAVLFLTALGAELAHLEPIIGAFMAGLTLNRLIPERSVLMNRIQFVGNALFIPFFLISVGMLVNPFVLTSASALTITATMVVIALISKLLAAWSSGRILGFKTADSLLLYGMSVNQAAATLAAVLVGYRLNFFSDDIVTGTVMMILFTSLTGALVTNRSAHALLSAEEEEELPLPGLNPHILIGASRTESALPLMDLALLLKRPSSHQVLYPVTIVAPDSDQEKSLIEAEKKLAPVVLRAVAADIPVVPLTRLDPEPATGLARAAGDFRNLGILLGGDPSTSRLLGGGMLDSILEQTRNLVIQARLKSPLSLCSRVMAYLPPLLERHPGYDSVLYILGQLVTQAKTSVLLLTSSRGRDAAHTRLQQLGYNFEVNHREAQDRQTVMGVFQSEGAATDLLFLGLTRSGQPGWSPSLQKLPRLTALSLPGHNLLSVYAARGRVIQDNPPEMPVFSILYGISHAVLHMPEAGIEQAVYRLLDGFYSPEKRDELAPVMIQCALEEAVDLGQGIILVHSHLPSLQEYAVLLGARPQGFSWKGMSVPPRAFFLVLAPRSVDPERHLYILGALARLVRMKEFPELLTLSRDWGELKLKLAGLWTEDSAPL